MQEAARAKALRQDGRVVAEVTDTAANRGQGFSLSKNSLKLLPAWVGTGMAERILSC